MFYSVAQHSCLVSDWILEKTSDKRLAFAGLMHDASEAYVGDIINPIKKHLPLFQNIEKDIQQKICERFNITYPFADIINEADQRIVIDEMNVLFHVKKKKIRRLFFEKTLPLNINIKPWTIDESEAEFHIRFLELQWDIRHEKES